MSMKLATMLALDNVRVIAQIQNTKEKSINFSLEKSYLKLWA